MDPYQVLGIEPGASSEEITQAYRVARKKHHPDAGGDAWAYQLVKDAYKKLTSGGPEKHEGETTVAATVASAEAVQKQRVAPGPAIDLEARPASTAARKKRNTPGVGMHIIGAVGGSITALTILFVAMQNGWLDGLAGGSGPADDPVVAGSEGDNKSSGNSGAKKNWPRRPRVTPRAGNNGTTRPKSPPSTTANPPNSKRETTTPRAPMPQPSALPTVKLPPQPLVESLQNGFAMRTGPAVNIRPAIAGSRSGHFVVCWPGTDSSGIEDDRLEGILFPADGDPVLLDARDVPLNGDSFPDVCMDESGAFVATWAASPNRPQGPDICVLRFDATGVALDKAFVINTFRRHAQTSPSIGTDKDGNCLVAWMSRLQKSGGGWGIYGQAFDAQGEAIGQEFEIADFTDPRRQGEPHVTFRPNGRPLISVTNTNGNPAGIAMYGYDRQGNRRESPVFLRPGDDYQLGASRCAISPNGRLGCIVWQVKSPDENQWDVLANLFNERGLLHDEPFVVNQTRAGDQVNPVVEFVANNTVVVAWEGAGVGDNSGVFARYFERGGKPVTDELRINSDSQGEQSGIDLAVSADRHLVTWVSRDPQPTIHLRDIAPLQTHAPAEQ